MNMLSKREYVSRAEWHAAILAVKNAMKLAGRLGEAELAAHLERAYDRMVQIADKVFPD
jgi:hypothetical protein